MKGDPSIHLATPLHSTPLHSSMLSFQHFNPISQYPSYEHRFEYRMQESASHFSPRGSISRHPFGSFRSEKALRSPCPCMFLWRHSGAAANAGGAADGGTTRNE